MLAFGDRPRFIQEAAGFGCASIQSQSDPGGRFAGRDGLHTPYNLISMLLELPLELSDEGRCLCLVRLLEGSPGDR